MVELNLTEKTGFKVLDPYKPIVIRDARGILFYSTESILPDVKVFNLPGVGKLFVDSGSFVRSEIVDYPFLELPEAERNFPDTKNFKIVFGDNPHKCTINFRTETIFFDNAFKSKPLPEIFFILFHEEGHQYYLTEKYVDLYASNCMLAKGFNPEQIRWAHKNSLSERQEHRKMYVHNRMIEAGLLR